MFSGVCASKVQAGVPHSLSDLFWELGAPPVVAEGGDWACPVPKKRAGGGCTRRCFITKVLPAPRPVTVLMLTVSINMWLKPVTASKVTNVGESRTGYYQTSNACVDFHCRL